MGINIEAMKYPMTDPWDGMYIYLHLPSESTIHVGKYTFRPMDSQGFVFSSSEMG